MRTRSVGHGSSDLPVFDAVMTAVRGVWGVGGTSHDLSGGGDHRDSMYRHLIDVVGPGPTGRWGSHSASTAVTLLVFSSSCQEMIDYNSK